MKNIPIGEVLKEYGYITQEQLQSALDYQREHRNLRVGQILLELGFVSDKQVVEALAQRMNLKTVDVSQLNINPEVVAKIPRALATKYHILAVGLSGQVLTVVTNDPLNFYALEDIRQITGLSLEILLSEQAPLDKAIEYYYAEVGARQAAVSANKSSQDRVVDEFSVDMRLADGEEEDAPIIRLLNSLVQRGISTNASDIHIEPFDGQTTVRMRIDGVIVPYVTLQRALHQPLIARIKIMSNLDIAEHRLPQDGHFRVLLENENINVRVSILPTVFGEKAVLRILANNARVSYAEQFGMDDEAFARFKPILRNPNGIVYITGPTGSGKTTTLYMVLAMLSQRQANISTIEDPVEKNLPGINQTQVNPVAGLTFESGLRSLLRQDPDIIMVGETRDGETASISVRAAITGHLVLSTLHTNDAVSSLLRLADMGVERYLIASSVVGLVAQRLMRKVCPHCARRDVPTPEECVMLGVKAPQVMRAVGCPQCNNTGYRDRIAVHEIVNIDREMRRLIVAGATNEELYDHAVNVQKMKPLRQSAIELVLRGITTPEELLKITYFGS